MKALVTGAGGFLGGAVAGLLLDRGHQVRGFSRGDYPALRARGASFERGDIADAEAVQRAAAGCDIVFHCAAKAGVWGPYEEYRRANIEGTRNVLAACRALGIRKLVYTSSPSVVFDGRDAEGIDESAPYPKYFDSHYSATKAVAEEMVLAADDRELSVVALRPHLLWGPGDTQITPRIIAKARAGVLRRIETGRKLVDTTYISDAAEAHLLAAERLAPGAPPAGKAYFISSGDPRPIWEVIDLILGAAGLPPVQKTISPRAALAGAAVLEAVHRILRLPGEPRLTRFMVLQLSTAHWFNIAAAKRDLGYEPKVKVEEGMERLKEWFIRERERERN